MDNGEDTLVHISKIVTGTASIHFHLEQTTTRKRVCTTLQKQTLSTKDLFTRRPVS